MRDNKEMVVCFRIAKTRGQELDRQFQEAGLVGVKSPHQLARKVLIDYLDGKLAYAHPGLRTRPVLN